MSGAGQVIARVVEPRGSNQLEVELPDGGLRLVIIPSKFHKVVFFKKGDLVIVEMEPSPERIEGKVLGCCVAPLQPHHVKYLHGKQLVPLRFSAELDSAAAKATRSIDDMMPPGSDDEDGDGEGRSAGGNLNRRQQAASDDDEEEVAQASK